MLTYCSKLKKKKILLGWADLQNGFFILLSRDKWAFYLAVMKYLSPKESCPTTIFSTCSFVFLGFQRTVKPSGRSWIANTFMHTLWFCPNWLLQFVPACGHFCLAVVTSVPRGKPSSTSYRRDVPVGKENREIVPDRENPTGSRTVIIIAVLLC